MKKILFVIPTISCGGAERAMVELLKCLDYSKYDVDLMLFRKDDMYYLPQIPKEVNILENDNLTKLCFDHVKHFIKSPLFFKRLDIVIYRILETIRYKILRGLRLKTYCYDWQNLKKFVPKLDNKYDTAIGFLEGNSIFYVIDKVCANKKIGFFHTSYKKGDFDEKFDKNYFEKLNCLFAVSDEMRDEIVSYHPLLENRIKKFDNILNVDELINKSNNKIDFEYDCVKIISVGNLRYVKGYDIAIDACKILKDRGYNFKWFVLGEGKERKKLEAKIKKNNLEDNFILLGLKDNPYPYIKRSDIFVQCSRHEGFSTTVREVKILKKPIVITDCQGMREQIINNVTGFITTYDPYDIANSIAKIIDDKNISDGFIKELYNNENEFSIESQLKIFYDEI